MKRLTEVLHSHAASWAPRIAFMAAFGVTGVTAVALHRAFDALHSKIKKPVSKGYEDPTQD